MTDVDRQTEPLRLSVVICTYNRCTILPHCLDSLLGQSGNYAWEVLVVDNRSTDETRSVVESYVEKKGFSNLRYVYESEQGLSHARNRGWQEAAGEFVGFLDDDGKATARWLSVALGLIEKTEYQIFGGPYVPFYLSEPPKWWQDNYRSGGHGDAPCELADWQFLSGGNLFIRRALLEELGGFSPEHGMTGEKVGLGEETLLQMTLRERYPELPIYYEPELKIEHLVSARKMTLRWLVPLWFEEGCSESRLQQRHRNEQCLRHVAYRLVSSGIKALFCGAWALVVRNRRRYRYWQNYLVEDWSRHVRELGKDIELWQALRSGRV